MRLASLLLATLLSLAGAGAAPAQCGPDALGTARVMRVGTAGGGGVGLKSYPRTLALADKEIVLTFDDGPLPGPTTKVLDALKKDNAFLKAGGVFTDDFIESYIELKMQDVARYEMTPHPVEFDMYYSY